MDERTTISCLVLTMALWAGGCVWKTTESSAGSFITDLGVVGERLYVRDCYVDLEVTETFDFINGSHSRSSEIAADDCRETLYALPDGLDGVATTPPVPTGQTKPRPAPTPPRPRMTFTAEQRRACAVPLAQWRQQPAEQRARTFAALPAVCRRMVGEPGAPR